MVALVAEIEVDPVGADAAGGRDERELFRALVGELLDTRPEVVATVSDVVVAHAAFAGAVPAVPLDEVRAATDAYLTLLRGPEGRSDRTATRGFGRRRLQQGVALPPMLDALRAGSLALWEELVAYGRSSGAVDDSMLVALAADHWALHDEYLRRITEGYRAEELRMQARQQAERSALVDALLSGRPESDLREAAARLDLPPGGFVVVAARARRLAEDPMPGVDRELDTARIPSAWRLRADARIGVVSLDAASTRAGRRHRSDAPVENALEVVRHVLRQTGATVGISPRLDDWSFAESGLRFALIALEAAPDGEVADFGERPMSIMAAAAPEVARRAANRVLEGIAAAPEVEGRLLVETVRTWFDQGGSSSGAAEALFVHASTIRHRLRRFEELTHRSLADPRDAAEVLFALTALDAR